MSSVLKKCIIALLTAAVLAVGPCGAGVLAAMPDNGGQEIAELSGTASADKDASAAKGESDAGSVPDDSAEGYIPDPEGTVSFANVNRRMHGGNLQVLAIQESIDMLEELDYDDLKEYWRDMLHEIANNQWSMMTTKNMMIQAGLMSESEYNSAYEQLEQAYAAAREQFDAIKDGDMQEDNAVIIRQLKNLQNHLIMAGEATYIALAAMEIQEDTLERQLGALDRQLAELDLRYKLGQISALTLLQAQNGRVALVSGLTTLRMNLNIYKGQLELLLGENITGNISMGDLPGVTWDQLNGMDLERDLVIAKENSWDLYEATETFKDEEEAYHKSGGDNGYAYKRDDISYMQARHNWYAAKYTYENTVQNFELGLRNLYLKIQDYRQILDAAKNAYTVEHQNYEVAQLKQSQGTLSENGLLEAEDRLKEAREKVASAENDLFSSYNTYRWAVDYGILN